MDTYHLPALLNETVDLLNIRPGKKFLDATLGGGGHSAEIIRRGGILLGIDQDPEAIKFASERLNQFLSACPTTHLFSGRGYLPPVFDQGNFSEIDKLAKKNGFAKFDGILFDLGVSSHQLESPERGFSFNQDTELDMRMSPSLSVTAKDLINGLTEKEMSDLFFKYGEEERAKKYAREICLARKNKPITTGRELSDLINKFSKNCYSRINPATKVFQALRIAVNDELNCLKEALPKAVDLLESGGRLAVISFHSLEDGIVKRFFLEKENNHILKIINQKPILPTKEEINFNPRSRSAKLRVAEKL